MTTILGTLLLLIPIVPLVHLYTKPAFIRRLTLFPKMFFSLSSSLVLYGILSFLVAYYLPQYVLPLIVLASPLILYVYWWRPKPSFGCQKGLPPGSLRIAPSGPWVDYVYYQKQAKKFGQIFKMNNVLQPMICITGIERGIDFIQHHEHSTMTPPMPFNNNIPNGFMRYMTPASYLELRNKMKVVFADNALLERNGEAINQIIQENLWKMTACPKEIHPAPYFQDMGFAIFAMLFLGLSPHEQDFGQLQNLYKKIDYRRMLFSTPSTTKKNLREIEEIFLNRAKKTESFVSQFFSHKTHQESAHVNEQALIRNLIYLLQTSWIDVSDLFTWIFKLLSDNPQWSETLHEHLHSEDENAIQDSRQLANRIVLETLRMEQSEYLMRKALHDIRFEEYLIPKGWLVRIGIRESHRDPQIFHNPNEFNPDRFLEHHYGPKQYSPFGIQQKSCLGKGLTLWVARQFVLELVKGFEWRILNDGPRELGFFHWKPSSKLRIRLSQFSSPCH